MEIDTTTLYDIIEARLFTQAYLGLKFKGNNDEFFHIVFEEWWHTENRKRPLEEFLDEKRDKIKWWIKSTS